MKKKFDERKARVWGSSDYLIMRYEDIDAVRELTRSCKPVRSVKRIVAGAWNKKNGLAVHAVYETTGTGPDGTVKQVVAHVSVGLNGGGDQADYLAGLTKVVQSGKFRIFDAYVDYVDDLADVLLVFRPGGFA